MRLHRMASTWPTPGKANFPGRISKRMVSRERRRWDRFHRTATDSTTWPATFGSGPLTGIRSTGGFTILLRELQSEGRRTRQKLRSEPASDQDPAQSHERRIAFVRAKLLPALSTGGAHGPAHRYVNVSSGLSLHRAH